MTKKITYTDEPLGDIEVVADFLPFPADVAFHEEGVKVTLALSKSSVDFFKLEAAKHQTQYRRMIRRLLDSYGEAHAPEPIRGRPKRSVPKRQAHNFFSVCMRRPGFALEAFSRSPPNLFSGV